MWASRRGWLASDPGDRLATPAAHRPLPGVLKQSEAAALLDVVTTRADDGDPVHVRDRLILELLYATGMRVGELVGLDDMVEQRAYLGHAVLFGAVARSSRSSRVVISFGA